MADDVKETDFFQKLFKVALEILEPVTELFGDDAAKEEMLGSLGLDSTTDIGDLPPDTNLRAYIEAEASEVDAFMLASAMTDFIQISLVVEGIVRIAIDSDDAGDNAIDELVSAWLNILTMEWSRRHSPVVYGIGRLISTINENAAAAGGNIALGKMVKDFLAPVGNGLETAESARGTSALIGAVVGGGLFAIHKWLLTESQKDNIDFRFGYGYEGITESESVSGTPIADAITDRVLSYSITARPFDDPDTQGTVYNTISLVPKKHDGIAVVTELSGEIDTTIPVNDDISFKIDAGGDGIFRIIEGASASPGPGNRAKITFKHKVNKPDALNIFKTPEIKTGLKEYSFALTLTPDDFDIKFSGKFPFLLKREENAGFPQSLLPKEIKEDIPLDFGYSIKNDIYFGNGGGNPGSSANSEALSTTAATTPEEANFLEKLIAKILNMIDIRAAIHKDIGGVVGIQALNIKAGVVGDFEATSFETSIDFWVKFGSVLTISISRLGAELHFIKREDSGGFLGTDVTPKFKPPTGAGIAVNAEVIKGGGFLYFDDTKGEYFGAIELEFKEIIALKAIGIINTIMPNGEKGFSMLILVTGEFSPISLAFGFTLDGVGGLLGVDRTVSVEALRIGVRSNAIRSILFPEDVVGNISRIISDIKDFFPIKEDQFVVGLMAQIGYAGSNLVKIELGVILEVPDPKVVIVGVVRVVAPDEDKDALKLQVNFLGVIDFHNEYAYLEAHLYDSHVVGFPLTGTLAFAVGWGNNGLFAVSVGGFHPEFIDYPSVPTLPGAFRNMSRLGFSLLKGDNPSLTIECYFAVTSNTLQFGAKLELLAKGPMGFNLYGLLDFDALFIFDPFSFEIGLQATLAIRKGTRILFGISFRGELSGTSPWHIEGEVTFGILFFDVSIGFSETWGDTLDEITAETADLVGMIRSELREERNWRVEMSQGLHHTVTHRAIEHLGEDEIVIYPFGELSFSQRQLPLNYKIEKFGSQRPLDDDKITISEVRLGNTVQNTENVKELFAAGHFTRLTEQAKLSRKSFERFDSGFNLKDSGKLLTATPDLAPVDLDYELNYTDDDIQPPLVFGLDLKAFSNMHRHAAVAKSDLGWSKAKDHVLNQVKVVEVPEQGFSIANTSDLKEVDSSLRSATLAEAKAILNEMVANDPSLEDEVQVVQSYELAG